MKSRPAAAEVAPLRDLDDPDDFAIVESRRTDDFMDEFLGFPTELYVFENIGMPGSAEIIVDLGAAFAVVLTAVP